MREHLGRLVLDGQDVPDYTLRCLRQQVHEAVKGLPTGAVVCVEGGPLTVLVTRLVAHQQGLVVVLGSEPARLSGLRADVLVSGQGQTITTTRHTDRNPGGAVKPNAATAVVFATSGSTGEPKAAELSWAGLDYQAEALREHLSVDSADLMLMPLPLTHAYGSSVVELWMRFGAGLALESAFSPQRVTRALATLPVTTLDAVPSMISSLLRQQGSDEAIADLLGGLRLCNVGGDVLPLSLSRAFLSVTGSPLLDGYGLTEAGPNVAISTPEAWRVGTVGRPLPGTEIRVSPEGEVLTRSPSTFLGYLGDETATHVVVDRDGWLNTGDVGTVDADGYLTVTGRIKDVIVIHGESFAPSVIEDALVECPGVADVGVVPRRRADSLGDEIVAFVSVRSSETPPDLVPTMRRAYRRALPPQLRPSEIRIVPFVPRTLSGKVDRRTLRGYLTL